jgi:hypothetical protein
MNASLHRGTRVRFKLPPGLFGTVLAMPGEFVGPPDLFAVLGDDGELRAVHAMLLGPTGEADGFRISRQMLIERRRVLFVEMVDTIASMRQIDLGDPAARQQVENQVKTMSRSWADADGTRLRRREFLAHPEHRQRFVRLVTVYLELGETLNMLGGKDS